MNYRVLITLQVDSDFKKVAKYWRENYRPGKLIIIRILKSAGRREKKNGVFRYVKRSSSEGLFFYSNLFKLQIVFPLQIVFFFSVYVPLPNLLTKLNSLEK